MFLNPFDGPRAKIKRAKEHFKELLIAERSYREEQPIHLEVRPAEGGGADVIAVADKLPGLREATIVADFLGGFRSALDLAVCEASRLMGATNVKNTYFHFGATERQWDEGVNGRMKAAPAEIRAVVRALKPWSGGNHTLYALSKLASKDKHQLLVPMAGSAAQMMIDNFKVDQKNGRKFFHVTSKVPQWAVGQREAPFMHVDAEPSDVTIGGPVVLSLKFAFGDVDVVPNQPVIPLLYQIGRMCEEAVGLIESATK